MQWYDYLKIGLEVLLGILLVWNLFIQTRYGGKLLDFYKSTSASKMLGEMKSLQELLNIEVESTKMYKSKIEKLAKEKEALKVDNLQDKIKFNPDYIQKFNELGELTQSLALERLSEIEKFKDGFQVYLNNYLDSEKYKHLSRMNYHKIKEEFERTERFKK